MPTLTLPYTFVNGTTADALQVDADFNAVSTVVNGLDNANVGANGFYASQIIPVAAYQAQFGGALGYKFAPGAAAQVPLTIQAAASQTADMLDIVTSALTKVVWVDSNGVLNATTLGIAPSTVAQDANLGLKVTGVNMQSQFTGVGIQGVRPTLNLAATGTGGQTWGIISGDSGGFTAGGLTFFNEITSAIALTLANNGVATFGSAVNVPGYLTLGPSGYSGTNGDINISRSTTTGAMFLGGASSRCGIDYGVTTAGVLNIGSGANIQGATQAQRSGSFTLGMLAPSFVAGGTSADARLHTVVGQVTAAAATTTINFVGAAQFNVTYLPIVFDATAGSFVTTGFTYPTNGVSFPSTSGHNYSYMVVGW